MDVRESYDSAAEVYAEHIADELPGKPLDRYLLDRFAEAIDAGGLVADLGCGPGHVARYLHDRGVRTLGVDLSPAMIRAAARLNPGLDFRAGDMTALDLPDGGLAGVVAFYCIVHLDPSGLPSAFGEFRRVLAIGGPLLVAFHVGDHSRHVDDLWGQPVSLDFRFHLPAGVAAALGSAGFDVVETTERDPYEGVEYPSRRAYILARAA